VNALLRGHAGRGERWGEDDNAIEAVINEDEKIAEQLDEGFHGRPPKTYPAWTGQAHG
jgi:hypothetical protein